MIANFSKSTKEKPSLLRHHEVKTFFHEFGHAIHALFGKAEMPTKAAYNTKVDFIESPSQLLEEWMWDRDIAKWFPIIIKPKIRYQIRLSMD